MPKTNPLVRYAGDPSIAAVMREAAHIAIAKGFNQQRLAEELGYTAPAIIKHFKSARPSLATVQAYAKTLGVPEEYLVLFMTPREPLSRHRYTFWWRKLMADLEARERAKFFLAGTAKIVASSLSKLTDPQRAHILDCFIAGEYRTRHIFLKPVRPRYSGMGGLDAFAEALSPFFDLDSRLRKPRKGEDFLFLLWLSAIVGLSDDSSNKLIDYAQFLLERQGESKSDVEAMLEYLRSEDLYVQYHGRTEPTERITSS